VPQFGAAFVCRKKNVRANWDVWNLLCCCRMFVVLHQGFSTLNKFQAVCLSVCLILCSYLSTFYPGSGRAACDLLNVYRQLNLTIWVLHGLHYQGSLWKTVNFVLVETTVNLFSCWETGALELLSLILRNASLVCVQVRVKIQVGQVGNCSESVYFFHKIFGASSSIVVVSNLDYCFVKPICLTLTKQ